MRDWVLLLVTAVFLSDSESHAQQVDRLPLDFERRVLELAHTKQWQRLLHYEPSIISGRARSKVDGPGFFFASNGKEDPVAELRATVESFFKDIKIGKLKQHPQCAFPVRYQFLKKELGLQISDVACPELEAFLKKVDPQEGVSLVFSSAYANNPGSMFGHTFLRFISGKRRDMLDYTLGYAAYIAPGDDLLYVFKGIFGGYPGAFSVTPYHTKIDEYNNGESRDLIEYKLSLNSEEALQILRHTWELETNAWLDYYFFDENCASVLLDLIEIGRPTLDFPRPVDYITPGESVRIVADTPGLVSDVSLRPSLRKKLLASLDNLTTDQLTQYELIASNALEPESISNAAILDAANLRYLYLKEKGKGSLDPKDQKVAHALLLQRSKMSGASEITNIEMPLSDKDRPDKSHLPHRVSIATGSTKTGAFHELHAKLSLHDLLNVDRGYVPFSQLDFPSVTLRWEEDISEVRLQHLNLIKITSFMPMNLVDSSLSWQLVFDHRSAYDLDCNTCMLTHAEAGAGGAVATSDQSVLGYLMLSGYLEAGSRLPSGYRWGPKLSLGSIWNPWEKYKIHLSSDLYFDIAQEGEGTRLEARLAQAYTFNKFWDIRLEYLHSTTSRSKYYSFSELRLGVGRYF